MNTIIILYYLHTMCATPCHVHQDATCICGFYEVWVNAFLA